MNFTYDSHLAFKPSSVLFFIALYFSVLNLTLTLSNLPWDTSRSVRSTLFPETKDQKDAKSFQIRFTKEAQKVLIKQVIYSF